MTTNKLSTTKRRKPAVREAAAQYDAGTETATEVPAGEFKARCLAIMDDVHDRGTEYVITKHGRPVAKLVPVERAVRPLFGSMRGTVSVRGDIVSPIGASWDALGNDDDE